MTALVGALASTAIIAASSGFAGGAIDARTVVAFPFTTSFAAAAAVGGARTAVLPSTYHRTLAGALAESFALTDWYNRIHISTSLLALGNVVSAVTKTVSVWNAWLESTQTLNSVGSVNAAGITVTPPGATPLLFHRNQEMSWTFSVSVQGPPTVDAIYTWYFADSEAVILNVTGNRVTAWALTPDWAAGVKETLSWKTDVLTAWSGAEQRRALRIAPRRSFEFEAPMAQQERRVIEAALFSWSAMVWALPIWSDGQLLASDVAPGASSVSADTTSRDFVAGGLAILITDAATYEVLQISVFTSSVLTLANPAQGNWPAGTRLYPVRTARLLSYPKISRYNSQFAAVKPQFETMEPCDWTPASGLPAYRGYPVLENSPDDGGDISYTRQANVIDYDTGIVEMDDTADVGFPVWMHQWFMQGRTQRAALRSLLYLLKGRQGEVWVPSYQSDLEATATISSTATSIDVQQTGYTLYLSGQVNRQDMRIELLNRTVFYRRITGSAQVTSLVERLSIDSQLGQNVAVSQIRRISYMILSRLASDSIDISHVNGDQGLALAATQFRATNHNV